MDEIGKTRKCWTNFPCPVTDRDDCREVLVVMHTCRKLGLAERTDPLRDTVARKVIELAKTGVHDPRELRDRTLEAFRE